MSIHKDLIEWQSDHGSYLTIGTKVKISPDARYYEARYDEEGVYTVVMMFVDSGGLNIGINDGHNDKYLCETDGFYIADLMPAPVLPPVEVTP